MYYQIYNILHQYIYGLEVVLNDFQELSLTLVATGACLFVVALPFLLVWKIIRTV